MTPVEELCSISHYVFTDERGIEISVESHLGRVFTTSVDLARLRDGVSLNRIKVADRVRGLRIGSLALDRFLSHADRLGVTVYLTINPYGALTYKDLEAWYLRRGFVIVPEGESFYYMRTPRGSTWPIPTVGTANKPTRTERTPTGTRPRTEGRS